MVKNWKYIERLDNWYIKANERMPRSRALHWSSESAVFMIFEFAELNDPTDVADLWR